jgi:biopolymer transport protein ExbD
MYDDLFPKKQKKILIGLQLAPLIDVFVLIIIFLIKGTVMNGASLAPPEELKPAKSNSPESVEPAGQLYITQKEVYFGMINEKILTSELLKEIENHKLDNVSGKTAEITQKLKSFISNVSKNEKKSGILMNFLADAAVDYRTTFEVSKFCRELGFENILYVAQGMK